jgi:hypothetical protein
MTTSLEKIFFNWILDNRKYYEIVMPYFFRNIEIQFIYGIMKKYFNDHPSSDKPTPKQIWEMVSLEDRDGKITKDILKSILKENPKEYDEKNFIEPKFNTWVLLNRLRTGTVDVIDRTRNFDDISDFETAKDAANGIKDIIDTATSINFIQDDDLGSDFDNPEDHVQDSSKFKVKSGFSTIDHMLGGGWDIQTLNCVMAETNNGKCSHGGTKIRIRNKENGEISQIMISELLDRVKKINLN